MNININTTNRVFFRQALEVIKILPPLDKLRGKELDLLAELLYYNHLYSNIDIKLRGKLIFDYDTKILIRDYLEISEAGLNNLLTSLRKKNIITKRDIVNTYGISIDNPKITFNFSITDES